MIDPNAVLSIIERELAGVHPAQSMTPDGIEELHRQFVKCGQALTRFYHLHHIGASVEPDPQFVGYHLRELFLLEWQSETGGKGNVQDWWQSNPEGQQAKALNIVEAISQFYASFFENVTTEPVGTLPVPDSSGPVELGRASNRLSPRARLLSGTSFIALMAGHGS